ncbi:hypothetical protein CICLE_v10010832mg [Citrus x clementina]|uniref:Uncharacterized protein n=1 Tax=Citrus clementina TaxID=85681 RepID=V4UMB7_CITCL|nr:hypothetical protein CICLE_v10010832mg [Citrus x clementina]
MYANIHTTSFTCNFLYYVHVEDGSVCEWKQEKLYKNARYHQGSFRLSWRQVLKHAWAEGCIRFSRVNKISLLRYKALLKSTCFSFKANSCSTFRGCFRKGGL